MLRTQPDQPGQLYIDVMVAISIKAWEGSPNNTINCNIESGTAIHILYYYKPTDAVEGEGGHVFRMGYSPGCPTLCLCMKSAVVGILLQCCTELTCECMLKTFHLLIGGCSFAAIHCCRSLVNLL